MTDLILGRQEHRDLVCLSRSRFAHPLEGHDRSNGHFAALLTTNAQAQADVPHQVWRFDHRVQVCDTEAAVCRDTAEELVGRNVVDIDEAR